MNAVSISTLRVWFSRRQRSSFVGYTDACPEILTQGCLPRAARPRGSSPYGGHMVIDRIHLGPVVFAKTLAESIAAREAATLQTQRLTRPHPIDRSNHMVEGFHQRQLNSILRRLLQRIP
jgi:hypothetical protein